jgi:hypothetical protein
MFVYVLDRVKAQWIETEQLFLHDIALLIDNKAKKGYLWFGSKSELAARTEAERLAKDLISKYKSYELLVMSETIPLKVEIEIQQLLGEEADPTKNKMPRTKSTIAFWNGAYCAIASFLVVVFLNMRMLFFDNVNGNLSVDQWTYNDVIRLAVIVSLISCGIYVFELITALITKKTFLVICAAAGLAMVAGATLYQAEGEFLFEFLDGSPANYFWIRLSDVITHIIWLVVILGASSGPMIYCIIAIKNTTEVKQKPKERRIESTKPSLLRDNRSEITEIK